MMVVQGSQEKRRHKLMDGLRRSVITEKTVKVGDLLWNMESKKVVKPSFTTDFVGGVVREVVDELTLRAEGGMLRTFIDTSDYGDKRWGPPLVARDWHAICPAIFQGVDGPKGNPCTKITRSCTKQDIWRKEGHGALVFARSIRQRNIFFTIWAVCRRLKRDPKYGLLGNPRPWQTR